MLERPLLSFAALLGLAVQAGCSLDDASSTAQREAALAASELRLAVLRAHASDYLLDSAAGPWGVVMDTAFPEGVSTVVALRDGSASLYYSSGGGVVGAGDHPAIAAQARKIVESTESLCGNLSAASNLELPDVGSVRLFSLADSGLRSLEAPEEALGENRHPCSPLFHEVHELIFLMLRASERSG